MPSNQQAREHRGDKKPGRAEKITTIVKNLANGKWDESDAMTYDMPLWMEKGDSMMKAAGDLRLQQARKKWVQPKLRAWQIEVENLIMHQNSREILFVIDTVGNRGKSWFCQYMMRKHNAVIFHDSDNRTWAYMWQLQKIVLFDILRSGIPCYSTMESFKNGHVISDKYVCAQKSQENVKVAVFLHHVPQCHQYLSAERVRIYNLDEERPHIRHSKTVPTPSKKSVRFEKTPYSRPVSPAESNRSDSTTQSLRELCSEMTLSKEEKRAMVEEHEQHLLRKYGQSIAKDLGEINRNYGYVGVSQAMKLVKDYLLKCRETGEAIEICDPDKIERINVWKKESETEKDWSAKPKPEPEQPMIEEEEEGSDEEVTFQGIFLPKLPQAPRTVEVKLQEPFVIVSRENRVASKDIKRSLPSRPVTPDRPPHLSGTLVTPEGWSSPPPQDKRKNT